MNLPKTTIIKHKMMVELEITESDIFGPTPAAVVEAFLQRLVDPGLRPDDPWTITKVTVTQFGFEREIVSQG